MLGDPKLLLLLFRSMLWDEDIHSTFDLFIEFNGAPGPIISSRETKTDSLTHWGWPLTSDAKLLGFHYCSSKLCDVILWARLFLGVKQLLGIHTMSRFWKSASLFSSFLLSACYSEFRSVSISRSSEPLLSDSGFGFLCGLAHKHCNWVTLWLQFRLVSSWQAISWTCAMDGTDVELGNLSKLPIRRGSSL